MKELSALAFKRSREFILDSARPLDKVVFNYFFENGTVSNIWDELKKFQNKDGGFGHGLEPDIQLPASSNMATTFAFQYFNKLGISRLPGFLSKGLTFFSNNYSEWYEKWLPVPPDVNGYPHAQWWAYNKTSLSSNDTWGNPTVEIIGYLLRYKNKFSRELLGALKERAVKRLLTKPKIEPHELQCYMRFEDTLKGSEKRWAQYKING